MEPEQAPPRLEEKQRVWAAVTPLSKYLALALFVTMPFIGGWIGYHFAPVKVVEVENVVVREKDSSVTGASGLMDQTSVNDYLSKSELGNLSLEQNENFTCPELYSFDETVSVGDTIAGMEVTAVEPLQEDQPQSASNIHVVFSGPVTVTGIPIWEPIGNAYLVMNTQSTKMLPCYSSKTRANPLQGIQTVGLKYDADTGSYFTQFDDDVSRREMKSDLFSVVIDQLDFRIFTDRNAPEATSLNRFASVESAELIPNF